jgi:DNA-binding transcriptional LysR family regulator
VAAPAYLDARGRPTTVDDLSGHTLLAGRHPDGRLRDSWPLRDGRRLPVTARFSTDHQQALLHATLAGGGIALLSEVTSGTALAAGELELVLPDHIGVELPLYAVVARRRLQPLRIRAFLDAAVAWFRR